jgi:hypothetical protein
MLSLIWYLLSFNKEGDTVTGTEIYSYIFQAWVECLPGARHWAGHERICGDTSETSFTGLVDNKQILKSTPKSQRANVLYRELKLGAVFDREGHRVPRERGNISAETWVMERDFHGLWRDGERGQARLGCGTVAYPYLH